MALDGARRSGAVAWVPESLTSAEETYRRGMADLRRQETRFFLFRDMRPVADTLALAEALAKETMANGGQRMEEGRERAKSALSRVAEALEAMDDIETRASLPRKGRVELSLARMGFVEASALMEAGAYQRAEAKAMEVLARARSAADLLEDAFLRFADEERVQTWQHWIAETVALSRSQNAVALVVVKERNTVDVYRNGRKIHSYDVDLGANNLAQKYRQGDRATPEGRYKIRQIKDRGQTRYYRALLLDYPTQEDLKRIRAAKEAGIIPSGAGPGALIEIHGEGGRGEDWTNGCVAVTNPQMDELFKLVRVGTPVTIVGGDGSSGTFSSVAEKLRRER